MLLSSATFKLDFPPFFLQCFTYGLRQPLSFFHPKEHLTLPAFPSTSSSLLIAESNFLDMLIEMLVRSFSEFLNRAEYYSLFDGLYFYYLCDSYLLSVNGRASTR